jgi:hypothetical protein
VVAAALGVVFYLKRSREWIADFFRRLFSSQTMTGFGR